MPDLAALLQSAARGEAVDDLDLAVRRFVSLSSARHALVVILDELVAPARSRPGQQHERALDLAMMIICSVKAPLFAELNALTTSVLAPQSGREAQAPALVALLAECLQVAADADADGARIVKHLQPSVRLALATQPGFVDRFGAAV